MRSTRQLEDLQLEQRPVILAVGSFDGVHKGHQAIFQQVVKKARALNGEAWVLTLDPHPLKILAPETAPPLITSTEHKIRLMEPFGIDGCIVMPFTREVSREEPETFLDQLFRGIPTLTELIVGGNWTFGHHGRGNVELLNKLASSKGFVSTVMDPVLWKGEPISSTRVRQCIADGYLDQAREMLGRPFSILGTVVHGKQIGTKLGFPTANLDPHNEVRPPSGVYAARVTVDQQEYSGAAFLAGAEDVKTSPSGFIVEVHLLDFEGDIYNKDIEIFFYERVRDVRHFDSFGLLRKQIALDVEQVRARSKK